MDTVSGPYVLTKTFNENAKQNLKMLILTEKGEKLTDIDFGCGLKRFLFEPENFIDEDEIINEVEEQVNLYASYITLVNVNVKREEHFVGLSIEYVINPTNTRQQDIFEVTS